MLVGEILCVGELGESLGADQIRLTGTRLVVGIRRWEHDVPQRVLAERSLRVSTPPRKAPAALVERLVL